MKLNKNLEKSILSIIDDNLSSLSHSLFSKDHDSDKITYLENINKRCQIHFNNNLKLEGIVYIQEQTRLLLAYINIVHSQRIDSLLIEYNKGFKTKFVCIVDAILNTLLLGRKFFSPLISCSDRKVNKVFNQYFDNISLLILSGAIINYHDHHNINVLFNTKQRPYSLYNYYTDYISRKYDMASIFSYCLVTSMNYRYSNKLEKIFDISKDDIIRLQNNEHYKIGLTKVQHYIKSNNKAKLHYLKTLKHCFLIDDKIIYSDSNIRKFINQYNFNDEYELHIVYQMIFIDLYLQTYK